MSSKVGVECFGPFFSVDGVDVSVERCRVGYKNGGLDCGCRVVGKGPKVGVK